MRSLHAGASLRVFHNPPEHFPHAEFRSPNVRQRVRRTDANLSKQKAYTAATRPEIFLYSLSAKVLASPWSAG